MTTFEFLLKKLYSSSAQSGEFAHKLNEAQGNPDSTLMVEFMIKTKTPYEWGVGFHNQGERNDYYSHVQDMCEQFDCLTSKGEGLAAISSDMGVPNSMFGHEHFHAHPMEMTFVVRLSQLIPLVDTYRKMNERNIESIVICDVYDALPYPQLDGVLDTYKDSILAQFLKVIKTKRSNEYCYLDGAAWDHRIMGSSRTPRLLNENEREQSKSAFKKIDAVTDSIKEIIKSLPCVEFMLFQKGGEEKPYYRLMNKTTFKKTFKAKERRELFAKYPQLEEHYA